MQLAVVQMNLAVARMLATLTALKKR